MKEEILNILLVDLKEDLDRELIVSVDLLQEAKSIKKIIKIHVDGSYKQKVNPNVAGWGFCVEAEEQEVLYTASGTVNNPVSRQIDGEIQAAKEAINWCLENVTDKINTKIEIYHDYEGLGKWADNLWKTNKPLTTEYKLFVSNARFSGLKVYFIWEKGHNNNFFNEIADELATSAVEDSVGRNIQQKIIFYKQNK